MPETEGCCGDECDRCDDCAHCHLCHTEDIHRELIHDDE